MLNGPVFPHGTAVEMVVEVGIGIVENEAFCRVVHNILPERNFLLREPIEEGYVHVGVGDTAGYDCRAPLVYRHENGLWKLGVWRKKILVV